MNNILRDIILTSMYIFLCLWMCVHVFMEITGNYYSREVPLEIELNPESLYDGEHIDIASPEILCLAKNIYHEARGEGIKGMSAVAAVTLNRVNSYYYPDNICDVVYQPFQFSWVYENMKIDYTNPINLTSWETSKKVALMILNNGIPSDMIDVLHYHADHIKPDWSDSKIEHKRIANHIFYTNAGT